MNDNKELQRQSDGVDALGHSGHTPAHDPDLVFGPVFFPPREVNKRFSIAGRASRQLEVESNGTFRRVAGEPSEGWFWSEQQGNFLFPIFLAPGTRATCFQKARGWAYFPTAITELSTLAIAPHRALSWPLCCTVCVHLTLIDRHASHFILEGDSSRTRGST